jgi:RecB family exonuclease
VSFRDARWPHLSCYGKIDLTERLDEGVVEVTDFKTGSAKTASAIVKLDDEGRPSSLLRQLAMYSYLIQGAEKGTTVRTSRLLFLEAPADAKDAVYAASITGEDIALLERDIADYDALLQSGEWVRRPCSAKLYGSTRECEQCAKAKELYV